MPDTPPIGGLLHCPPVGGTFQFQIFIQAPSPEIWRKTISGAEEGSGEEWGGLFLGYLLWKKLSAACRDHLVPPRRMQQSAVSRCAILSVGGSTGTAVLKFCEMQMHLSAS
jgi:hypothetical protein